ncbi:MAG: NmrA family NAD(P)-binding protein [Actinomycetota bacterium]|nr:NmrA family NAD(P)-binding protein [Actinomycetota bacterium]
MGDQSQEPTTILVTGGTGKTGRRVVERLADHDVSVRVGSRSGTPPFDWAHETTWAPALSGVDAAYIAYFPDLAFPGAVDAVATFSELAVAAGVERLVLLSGRGEEEAEAAERVVRDSGALWTIVRCSWFNQNFSESFLLDSALTGEIALPVGDAVEPFVDTDDIADVVVAALTDRRHVGRLYELTGPRLLSFHDVAAEITKATGSEVRYIPLTSRQYATVLRDHDLPGDFAELFSTILDGRNAHLTDGVRRALGREPKDFADFARDAAASGAWATN